jgi:undecaprenyl pyrophosphate synthase
MNKPEFSAGKAAILGAGVGAMVTGAGSPLIPMAVGAVAAGAAQAVANRRAAKKNSANAMEAHRALNKTQFKKQANWANDLDDGPVEEIIAYPAETIKRPKDPYS